MKNLSWLGILGAFVATAWMGALHAQVVDDAVAVPVHFQGRFDAENSNDYSNPASVTITALAANGTPRTAEGTSMTKGTYFTSGGFARLRPGRAY